MQGGSQPALAVPAGVHVACGPGKKRLYRYSQTLLCPTLPASSLTEEMLSFLAW
jgi:hypothetical protein